MSEMNSANDRYYAPLRAEWPNLDDEKLEKWARDPNCENGPGIADYLEGRRAKRALKRAALQEDPFDPHTEVSADAKHIAGRIAMHLWIIFVLLPIVLGVLWHFLNS